MVPIFFGGLIRKVVEKRCKGDKNLINKRREGGILFGSGLVGGDGLMGVLVGLLVIIQARPKILSSDWAGPFSILVGLAFFYGLVYLLIRSTKVEKSGTNDL